MQLTLADKLPRRLPWAGNGSKTGSGWCPIPVYSIKCKVRVGGDPDMSNLPCNHRERTPDNAYKEPDSHHSVDLPSLFPLGQMGLCQGAWKSRTTPSTLKGPSPTAWLAPMSVRPPMPSVPGRGWWKSMSQVGKHLVCFERQKKRRSWGEKCMSG